jgi:hypothetical protein
VTERRIFGLVHAEARKRAAQACAEAPDGWRVTIEPPKRTLDQNSLLWPLLQCFADQLEWPVNGSMAKLEPGEWKDILSAAYRKESARVALGLNGGMVLLGLRTSRMSKREFSEFVEFILSVAADRGVVTERDEVPA